MAKYKQWRIVARFKDKRLGNKWERETFSTGGGVFADFKTAQMFKNKLNKLSSSIEHKVVSA